MLSNFVIFVTLNLIALIVYFMAICTKYGCIYKNKNKTVLDLPFEGIIVPLETLLTNFPKGISMMLSFKNAWIYLFIASVLSIIIITVLQRYKKDKPKTTTSGHILISSAS